MSNNPESGLPNSSQAPGQAQGTEQAGVSNSPQTLSEELLAAVREEARKAVQAKEDRATARLEKSVQTQAEEIKRIAEMVKRGMTPDQIEDRLFLDNLKAERQGTHAAAPVASTNATQAAAPTNVDYGSIYKALELDPNSPDVLRITQEHPRPEQLIVKLAEYKAARVAQVPSIGAVSVPAGGTPNTANSIESLTAELNSLMKDPSRNMVRIKQKSEELRRASAQFGG